MELLETEIADEAPADAEAPSDETGGDELPEEEEELNCAACGLPITRSKFRTHKGGQFQHTCVNPAGVLYQIGCFSKADGCREVGAESDEFTWFAGYTWQIAVCASCKTHLGWHFWSPDDNFYGLILKKLA